MTNDSEILLRPSRGKLIGFLFLCLGFVGCGDWLLTQGSVAFGWLCIGVFAIAAIIFALQLRPGASYLRLNHDGFEFSYAFRKSGLIRWRDVSEFRAGLVPPCHSMVVYDSTQKSKPLLKDINRGLVGASDALPDTYGMKAEDLAKLMNERRNQAMSCG
jgi:hypothetical protein